MFKNIQIVHLPQLGPNVLHGNLESGIAVYRIVYRQNVYVTVNADRSGAHYRPEERDLALRAVEEISGVGHGRPLVVWLGRVGCKIFGDGVEKQISRLLTPSALGLCRLPVGQVREEIAITIDSRKILINTTRCLQNLSCSPMRVYYRQNWAQSNWADYRWIMLAILGWPSSNSRAKIAFGPAAPKSTHKHTLGSCNPTHNIQETEGSYPTRMLS